MKKMILLLLLLLFPSTCFAETSGYLFLGKYLNYGKIGLEGRDISYYAGIYIEIKSKKWPTLFIKETTLMRDIDERGAYPKQINYALGIKKEVGNFEIKFRHECQHAVDGRYASNNAGKFNILEGRLNF
jgi:hypothetical protein